MIKLLLNFSKYGVLAICTLFLFETGHAQLCTGSLGDPVINITFGNGPNPGPPLPASVTNYYYTTYSCPNDGFYSIISSTSYCFGGTWHNVSEDHTAGDVNGYMMLVNASFDPGVFYLDTVKNLCGGTTYQFSAWIMSILTASACGGAGIKPNITFSIETTTGTVIQTINTGDIVNLPFPQWNQYGTYLTLPTGISDLVLRLTNNAPGGCGNDILLDDITFSPCGPKVTAAFANINAADTANYCIADNKTITISGNVQSGYNNPAFQWQVSTDSGTTWQDIAGETNNTYTKTFSSAGNYLYRMTAAEKGNISIARCRVSSNVLVVIIDNFPVPSASSNSPLCLNQTLTLRAHNGYVYAWTGPDNYTSSLDSSTINTVSFNNTGEYYVLVTTKGGCSKQDSTNVIVNPLPNADAGNDAVICESTSTTLEASGGLNYQWSPVTGLSNPYVPNPTASPLITTTYTVDVLNQYSCFAKDSVTITVIKKAIANAGPDKKIMEGENVMLNGSTGGDSSTIFWTPSSYITSTSVLTPVVNPPFDMTYTLHATAADGCGTATDDVFVRVFQKIAVPNAFSPNGDGINDVWNIDKLASYPESDIIVFNRYGQVVFKSKGYGTPWNGTYNGQPLPVGTYYYTIDRKNDFPVLSGSITIIR